MFQGPSFVSEADVYISGSLLENIVELGWASCSFFMALKSILLVCDLPEDSWVLAIRLLG